MEAPKRLRGLSPRGRVGANCIASHCLCRNVTASPSVSPGGPRALPTSGGGAASQPPSPLQESWVRVGLGCGKALHLPYKSARSGRRSGWGWPAGIGLKVFHPLWTKGCLWELRKTLWRGWPEVEWKEPEQVSVRILVLALASCVTLGR